jgi:hypothetical protein
MNPIVYKSGILPLSEIRRLLAKCRDHDQPKGSSGRFVSPEGFTVADVARECNIPCRSRLYRLMRGDSDCSLGPVLLRRISRFLLKVEHGLAIKRCGSVVYLTEEERDAEATTMNRLPKHPDHVLHVEWSAHGPRLVLGDAPPAPKSLPSLFKDFKLPKR